MPGPIAELTLATADRRLYATRQHLTDSIIRTGLAVPNDMAIILAELDEMINMHTVALAEISDRTARINRRAVALMKLRRDEPLTLHEERTVFQERGPDLTIAEIQQIVLAMESVIGRLASRQVEN